MDDRVERGKCTSIEGAAVDSILIDSMKAGELFDWFMINYYDNM